MIDTNSLYKVVLIGGPKVGKTTLLKKLSGKEHFSTLIDENYEIGFTELIHNNNKLKISIFNVIDAKLGVLPPRSSLVFYRNTSLLLLMFSKNTVGSLRELDLWIEQAENNKENFIKYFKIVLIWNTEINSKIQSEVSPITKEDLESLSKRISKQFKKSVQIHTCDVLNEDDKWLIKLIEEHINTNPKTIAKE